MCILVEKVYKNDIFKKVSEKNKGFWALFYFLQKNDIKNGDFFEETKKYVQFMMLVIEC